MNPQDYRRQIKRMSLSDIQSALRAESGTPWRPGAYDPICSGEGWIGLCATNRRRANAAAGVADIDRDYATVRELMNAILAEGSGVAVSNATVETVEAVRQATANLGETQGASALEVARLLKLDKSAAWRRLSSARTEGFIVNLEERKGMPGKYRATGHKVEPVNILPTVADLHTLSVSLAKIDEPCNRDEIAQASQTDIGCKPHLQPDAIEQPVLHGCNRLQTDLATDNPLTGNGKSPPVARLRGFSGGTEGQEGSPASSEPDAAVYPRVCDHCGSPEHPDSPVQEYWVDGDQYWLHPACQTDWLNATSN